MVSAETETPNEREWRKTACILCECNCGLEVQVQDRALVKIRGDKQHPVSQGYSCEKPLRLDKYQNSHRISNPLKRMPDGSYVEISWATAFDEIATKLANVRDMYGGDKFFYYGGGGQGNHMAAMHGLALWLGLGGTRKSNALAQEKTSESWVDHLLYGNHTHGDFEHCQVAVFVGKNPWQSHGVARARPTLREIARDPKRSMIVIDPRRSETAELADIHLQLKPGTDPWCVSALAATLVQEELHNTQWLAEHTVGSKEVIAALRTVDIADHARRCGLPEEQIRKAARLIGSAESVATYEDLGIQHGPNATITSYLQKLIWILTGSFAKPGGVHIHSWMVPIAGRWWPIEPAHPPRTLPVRRFVVQAAIRTIPRRLLGGPVVRALARASGAKYLSRTADVVAGLMLRGLYDAIAVPIARDIIDPILGGGEHLVSASPVTGERVIGGLTSCNSIPDEILTDHPDRIRAIWIDSSNPVHSLAQSQRWRAAMRALDLSVVVDVAMTETARQADYVLPAASQFEKIEASLFTLHFPHNGFQVRWPLMDPLPGTKPEPEIYAEILDRLNIVEQRLLDDLSAAARISRQAFMLAFGSVMMGRPELARVAPYILYRTLGDTFGPGGQQLAMIWSACMLATVAQPDAATRAGFDAIGFGKAEQLFQAICARREGVIFSEDRYEDAWRYIQHADKRIHMAIPELLAELEFLKTVEPRFTSDEFPFILSAGERRSFTANVIIRNPEWRRRDAEGALRISEKDACDLGLDDGDEVRLVTAAGSAIAKVEISEMMQQGHISLPNGMGVIYPTADGAEEVVGVPLNSLTIAASRDKFFGNPSHKVVPARIEPIHIPAPVKGAEELGRLRAAGCDG